MVNVLMLASHRTLALVFGLHMCGVAQAEIRGVVVGISDGDTVTILSHARERHKVRVAGIDAPEKGQPFGDRSKQSLSDCSFGKQVRIEGLKLDRYGRVVGKILSPNGTDCGLQQVTRGMAWHYKRYQHEQSSVDRSLYARAEERARAGGLGVWQLTDPVPPWEFRRQ